ncbi:MAG: DUF1194 domain-containing protein [Paracoccaceae bacterium]
MVKARTGRWRPLWAALCAGLALSAPALAECRLALLLALDISSSVNRTEDRLQREGLAAALVSPAVLQALLANAPDHVALAAYEWSGRYQQDQIIGWRALRNEADIRATAEAIRTSRRSYAEFPTAAGFAMSHAVVQFQSAPACLFRTLDVSGDGVNNDGYSPAQVHLNHRLQGVTVNGLAIGGATENDADVIRFYREELIYGPGAFVEIARDYRDFERAMRRKLIREVSPREVAHLEAAQP